MNDKLKIALIGYGNMGQMIASTAPMKNIKVVDFFDENKPLQTSSEIKKKLNDVEVLLDFSVAFTVLDNVKKALELNKKLVIGTTGWYGDMEEIKQYVLQKNGAVIYGSNFSTGVNLFFKITEYAASLFSVFDAYETYIYEAHHKMKKDAPSGTALTIKGLMEKSYRDRELLITSVRAGYNPGTHVVNFDSSVDTVRLEHTARNRIGFAEGALLAANWIRDKQGFFEFQNVIDDILQQNNQNQ